MRFCREVSLAFALVATVAVPASARGPRAAVNVVRSIDVHETADSTVVVIHGSANPTFTVFKLLDPVRLFVDVANADIRSIGGTVDVDNGVVGQVGTLQFRNDETPVGRVIIGLDSESVYNVVAEGTDIKVIVDGAARRGGDSAQATADLKAEEARVKAAVDRERDLLQKLKLERLKEERLHAQAAEERRAEESLREQMGAARQAAEQARVAEQAKVDALRGEREALQATIAERQELEARLKREESSRGAAEQTRLAELAERVEAQRARVDEREQALSASLKQKEAALADVEKAYFAKKKTNSELAAEVGIQEARVRALKEDLGREQAQLEQVRAQRQKEEARVATLREELTRGQSELARVRDELEAAKRTKSDAREEQVARLQKELATREAEVARLATALERARLAEAEVDRLKVELVTAKEAERREISEREASISRLEKDLEAARAAASKALVVQNGLKRQLKDGKRKASKDEAKRLQEALAAAKTAGATADRLEKELQAARVVAEQARKAREELDSALAERDARIAALEGKLGAQKAKTLSLEAERSRIEAVAKKEATAEARAVATKVAALEAKLAQERARAGEKSPLVKDLEKKLAAERKMGESRAREAEKRLAKELADLEKRLAAAEREKTDAAAAERSYKARIAELERLAAKSEAELSRAEARLGTSKAEQAKAQRAAEVALAAQQEAAREATEAARLAQEKAARDAEAARLVQEKAARDAEAARRAQEQAARDGEAARLAKEQAAKAAEAARLAQKQAARDAEAARLAQEQAALDAKAALAAKEQAAKDAKAAFEEARSRAKLEGGEVTQQALREAEEARQAKELAEREARDAQLAKEQALREAREAVARAEARAEQEAARVARLVNEQSARDVEAAREEGAREARGAAEEALRRAERDAEAARLAKAQAERELEAARLAKAQAEREVLAAREAVGGSATADAAMIERIDFSESGGRSRVTIGISEDTPFEVVEQTGSQAVLRLRNAKLPQNLRRSLDTSDFHGAVAMVSSFESTTPSEQGDVRIVVNLRTPTPNTLRREGAALVWEFDKAVAMSPPDVMTSKPTAAAATAVERKRDTSAVRYYPNVVSQAASGGATIAAPAAQAASPLNPYFDRSRKKKKRYTGKRINLTIKDADIQHVLTFLAKEGKVNIIAGDEVSGQVTFHLEDIPWDLALDMILKTKGLDYVKEQGVYRIAPIDTIKKEIDDELEKKRKRSELKPLFVRLIPVNYSGADALGAQVEKILSPKGSVAVDVRTNTLIVKDIEDHIVAAEDLVRRLDTQTPQVLIEARIVEASSNYTQELGIQWGGNFALSPVFGNETGLSFPSIVGLSGGASGSATNTDGLYTNAPGFAVNLPAPAAQGSGGALGLTLGNLSQSANLNLRLSAAEEEGSVKIVSSPKISTLDNKQATIQQGISIPISVVSAQGVNTQFFSADLKLQVTPHVTQDGNIAMKIDISKNEPDFGQTGANGNPTIQKKEAHTELLLRDGDTTVIGGIYTRNQGTNYSKVPLLADIPILGWLFKSRRESDQRTELLIFITPRIVNRQTSVVQP